MRDAYRTRISTSGDALFPIGGFKKVIQAREGQGEKNLITNHHYEDIDLESDS
jgi:hypothetical protein